MMNIDPIKCADTRCTNRVEKLGQYCPACIEKQRLEDERIAKILHDLEQKPSRK